MIYIKKEYIWQNILIPHQVYSIAFTVLPTKLTENIL